MRFFFVLSLLLGLGSIMLTSLFSLFVSLMSVTGSYTEDEQKNEPHLILSSQVILCFTQIQYVYELLNLLIPSP